MKLIYRTLSAVLLPVIVGLLIPVLLIIIDPWHQPVFLPGLIVVAAGIAVTAVSIRDFYRQGGGTLAPWDAPVNLVVSGIYRYCRNPMYVGVLLNITGLALLFSSPVLLVYIVLIAAGFHLRVVKYEEPMLNRLFGKRWVIYMAMVNRWLPSPRWKSGEFDEV